MRISVGGDILLYLDNIGPPVANILETKLLINSVVSDATNGTRRMPADIKDYFLDVPMVQAEYMKVRYTHIPMEIRLKYNLDNKVTLFNYIYIHIKEGMY